MIAQRDAMRTRSPRPSRLLLLALLVAGCSGAADGEGALDAARGATDADALSPRAVNDMPPTQPAQAPRLPHFDPAVGPVGTPVEVWMDALPPSSQMYIGFGTVQEHTILQDAETDDEGRLRVTVEIPETARVNRSHYFFVADRNQIPLSVSRAFHVTAPDGTLEVRGEVVQAPGPCVRIRGFEEESYLLVGEHPDLATGDRVTVTGRAVTDPRCQGGLVIRAESVRVGS
jgi:hypothetical protein